jgi:hypothetical protein
MFECQIHAVVSTLTAGRRFLFAARAVKFYMFIIALVGTANLEGVEFYVAGESQSHILVGTTRIETHEFEAHIRDADWLMRSRQVRFSPGLTNAMLLDYYAFNNGPYVNTVAYASKSDLERLLQHPKTPEIWKTHPDHVPISLAWIDKARLPHADGTLTLAALFYAFCSHTYLNSSPGERLEPPYPVDGRLYSYDEGATNVSARLERHPHPPALPKQIVFLQDDKTLVGAYEWGRTPAPLVGFTNAVFDVVLFTNVGALAIPSKFIFSTFTAVKTQNGYHSVPSVRIEFAVKVVFARVEKVSLKPSLDAY